MAPVIVSGVWDQGAVGSRVCEALEPRRILGQFFRRSKGFIRTELVRDLVDHPGVFLRSDDWRSENEFREFREQHLAEYERLDKECEGFTEQETRLGAFWIGNR